MEELIELIEKAQKKYKNRYASLRLFSDESGEILGYYKKVLFEFENIEQLRNHLNE